MAVVEQDAIEDVTKQLVFIMDRFPTMVAVQEACVTALWQAWRAHRVLGLAVSGRPLATEANANVLRVSLAAMIHPSCQSLVPKLLARTQCCPLTLETIGGSADAVSAVLSETNFVSGPKIV